MVTTAVIVGLSVGLTGNAETEEDNSGGGSPSDPWFPNPETIGGLNSPYRYDCLSDNVQCTPLDEYVWRDDKDYKFSETVAYGSLIGPRPVKTFVMNMTSQNWLTGNACTQSCRVSGVTYKSVKCNLMRCSVVNANRGHYLTCLQSLCSLVSLGKLLSDS